MSQENVSRGGRSCDRGASRASLEGGTWLVFDLRVEEGADPDTTVADGLDRVWPAWRVCVAE